MATDVGQDLIPEVDNIHTFDTTIEVQAFNNIFTAANDTFKSVPRDRAYFGMISNDPIFGKTDARIFFQLFPTAGKKTFAGAINSRQIDSVVLSIPFVETYGDSLLPQNLEVSEISTSSEFKPIPVNYNAINNSYNYKRDSAYPVRVNNFQTVSVLGTASIIPYKLKDSILVDTAKVANIIRIKLNNNFGQRLLGYDTVGVNDGYSSDTVFKTKFNGFAVRSLSGNATLGTRVNNSVLKVYYKYSNGQSLKDTTALFAFDEFNSGYGYYIGRDYSGTAIPGTAGDNVADQLVYIQNTPGTYSNIKIPALQNLNNRIIHLAELQIESVHDASDTIFPEPVVLFMDMFDQSQQKFATIPYSFSFIEGQPNLLTFGSLPFYKKNMAGNSIRQWRFNLTRYVQNILNGRITNNELRLYAAPLIKLNYFDPLSNTYSTQQTEIALNDAPLRGRVRLGGGNHPTQKMKMRIVYSKI